MNFSCVSIHFITVVGYIDASVIFISRNSSCVVSIKCLVVSCAGSCVKLIRKLWHNLVFPGLNIFLNNLNATQAMALADIHWA